MRSRRRLTAAEERALRFEEAKAYLALLSVLVRPGARTAEVIRAALAGVERLRPRGKLPLSVTVHPDTGDVRCPQCAEFVNVRCWQCGWVRDTPEDHPGG